MYCCGTQGHFCSPFELHLSETFSCNIMTRAAKLRIAYKGKGKGSRFV